MTVKLCHHHGAADNQQVNRIAQIAQTASESRSKLIADNDAAVPVAFPSCSLSDGMPEGKDFARPDYNSVYPPACKIDINRFVLLQDRINPRTGLNQAGADRGNQVRQLLFLNRPGKALPVQQILHIPPGDLFLS